MAGVDRIARWLALGGVVGPIVHVVAFTIAGALRPGYSPIHQAISDLGVGSNGGWLDLVSAINGALLIGFSIGFALSMRSVLSWGWRWSSTALLALRGLASVTTATFTEAPATLRVHSLGSEVALVSSILAFFVVGLALLHKARWRGWGIYSLTASLVTLALAAFLFLAFSPASPLASAHLGGLMERLVVIESYAWFVAFGWRLFRGVSDIHVHQRS
jgi:hypothetical membrane protein